MHGTFGSVAHRVDEAPFECVIEGLPVSANNDRKAARRWRQRVAETAAGFLSGWRFRSEGDLAALIVLFHTGPFRLDTDNIPKHVLDALTGLVYRDDRMITQVIARRTRQGPGFVLTDPPPLVAAHLGACSHFVYVRIGDGPDHGAMPGDMPAGPGPGKDRS